MNIKELEALLPRYEDLIPRKDLYTELLLLVDIQELSKQDLIKMITWKLAIGRNRPGFLNRIDKNNSPEDIRNSTRVAFELVKNVQLPVWPENNIDEDQIDSFLEVEISKIELAVNELCNLYGIGVASATLLLSFVNSQVPFASDPLLAMFKKPLQKRLDYTWKAYKNALKYCMKTASRLKMKANQVQQCIWTKSQLQKKVNFV